MAGTTGLEPATFDVTGRRSNQLSYVPFCADKPDTRRITYGPSPAITLKQIIIKLWEQL
jgi:hypothetical protein